jgi:hypothetical protein
MKTKFYFQRSWLGYCLIPALHVYYARGTYEVDIYAAFWSWEIGVAIGLEGRGE